MYSINKHLYLIIFLILCSCTDHEDVKTVGEAEYYFDEKLSSISPDNDGSFWVGGESGDIFNFKDNYRVAFDLGEDRIYKINKDTNEKGDTIFWIGVRNSGLQKWLKQGSRFQKLKTYTINFKEEKYSPYDLVNTTKAIYIATSQGIYSLNKEHESDSLSLIFPNREFLAKQNGNSFVTHNIYQYRDSLLLVSTQNGVFVYNTLNNNSKFVLKDQYIEHVSVYNDTIFSISKNALYLNKLNGDLIEKIEIGNGPKLYYQIQGIHYLVGTEKLVLSNNLKDFLHINLRRTVPMKCRNVILPDTLNNFTYLLTENAVWKIPNNIDVFKGNKQIKTSCSNADNIYYLTLQNELYVQNKNSNKAKWIYTFPSDNLIQWMSISGDELYFYDIDNKVQKMRIANNWIKNTLFHSPKYIIRPKEKIISARIKDREGKPQIYIGIQDGMIIVNNNSVDTISQLSNAYITSMFGHKHTDRLYISTLNDGVFFVNQKNEVKQIPETNKTFFIQDIITTNDHNSNLIMLTNQQIISQATNDSIRVKGYKKLLYANDTLFYALPEFGIQKFTISRKGITDKGIFFKDICFNQNSTFSFGDKLVLGSNIGSIILTVNQENNPVWIEFDNAVDINVMLLALLTLIIIIAAATIIIIAIKKQNAHIHQIKKRKEDLITRVIDLNTFYSILDETKNKEVSELKKLIEAIDIKGRYKNDINSKLEEYSLRIGKLNRKVALLIPEKLEDQIEQISQTESFEKPQLLKQSNEAQNKNDIELIKEQVRINEQWLQQRTKLFTEFERNIAKLADSIEIEGVNTHLYDRLISLVHEDKHKPLSDLINLYKPLEKEIIAINSPVATEKINLYIGTENKYLEEKIQVNPELVFMKESLHKIKSQYSESNIELLKGLRNIEPQLTTLKELDEIKKLTIEYKEKYTQIIKENDEQINKKFDKELASFIREKTQLITHSIDKHISSLYNHLSETDQYIIFDILKLTNIEGQHARFLALLITDMKIKRSLIPGMLGIYGNLNPVISRLISDRIRTNESVLKTELEQNKDKAILAHLILKLLD